MQNYNFALIKPVSSMCSLRCRYCFYRDESHNRTVSSYGRMSVDILKKAVMYTVSEAQRGSSFLFQGGEPLLRGVSFFEIYNELCSDIRSLRPDFCISSSVQTSAAGLNLPMVRVLKEGRFLVGVSLDGPEQLHDINRVRKDGRGSFKEVFASLELLKREKVPVNILCVITRDNARPQELWRFFMDNGLDYLQFIMALNPLGFDRNLISGTEYADFFLEIFDLWFAEFCAGHYVSVRMIDDIFSMLTGQNITSCDLHGQCTLQNVIEADGSIYPCDFYVLDEWKLGNVCDYPVTIEESTARSFTEKMKLPDKCRDCGSRFICRNGCRRYRNLQGLNAYCETFRRIMETRKGQLEFVMGRIAKAKLAVR